MGTIKLDTDFVMPFSYNPAKEEAVTVSIPHTEATKESVCSVTIS